MNASPTYSIETRGLTRRFGDFTAVDGVDLRVEEGSFFGFLGPNGAGKSTTLKMLTGLLQPSGGEIRILGMDFSKEPEAVKQRLGVVPEGLALFDRLTGGEYLTFVGRMYGLDRRLAADRGEELLAVMNLTENRGQFIVDYSHGMQKKLALAASLIHNPRVLFLDEPFEGVDAIAARDIKDILTSLTERKVTIFLTSHVLEIVERLCTHIGIIHQGKLLAQDTLDALRSGGVGEGRETLENAFIRLVGGGKKETKTLSWIT